MKMSEANITHTAKDINTVEAIQSCAVRWACNSQWIANTSSWSIPSNDCLSMLHWPSLQTWRQYLSLCFLHNILIKRCTLNLNNFCKLKGTISTTAIIYHWCLQLLQSTPGGTLSLSMFALYRTPSKLKFYILHDTLTFQRTLSKFLFNV